MRLAEDISSIANRLNVKSDRVTLKTYGEIESIGAITITSTVTYAAGIKSGHPHRLPNIFDVYAPRRTVCSLQRIGSVDVAPIPAVVIGRAYDGNRNRIGYAGATILLARILRVTTTRVTGHLLPIRRGRILGSFPTTRTSCIECT